MGKKDKQPPAIIAVIDIGSNELRLKIAQSGKNKLKYIESLSYPLSLGRDTFDTGKISFEKVDKTCKIIKNFITVASEYGVTDIKAVATSAVREATNKDYILDQIKIKTSIDVKVIDDTEEKIYIYKLMMYLLAEKYRKSSLMVYIGSGNVGVSLLQDGKIPFMQNIKIGSLRLSELFMDYMDYSNEYYRVVEEYLEGFTSSLPDILPNECNQLIASGHEVSDIAELCQAREDGVFLYISRDKFTKIYNEIKHKTVDQVFIDYQIPVEKAEVIIPAMSILSDLLDINSATEIVTPLVSLIDALIFEKLYPNEFAKINKDFSKSTVLSAKLLANNYSSEEKHALLVEKYALKIFDKMKKIHGMGSREKVILQSAAILHDIGRFISHKKHYNHSYYIIRNSEIVGLNTIEKEIVALISMYHSRITPDFSHKGYTKLSSENKVLASKLIAILRIADSLDPSLEHKFEEVDVLLKDNELIITISTEKNTDLEQWFFNQKSLFFEEVFGIKATLKVRRAV